MPILKMMSENQTKLIELLHSLAMYNDKGIVWQRDSKEKAEAMRAKYRASLDELIARIGPENFPLELLRDLRGDEMLRDDSGIFAEKVAAYFAREK